MGDTCYSWISVMFVQIVLMPLRLHLKNLGLECNVAKRSNVLFVCASASYQFRLQQRQFTCCVLALYLLYQHISLFELPFVCGLPQDGSCVHLRNTFRQDLMANLEFHREFLNLCSYSSTRDADIFGVVFTLCCSIPRWFLHRSSKYSRIHRKHW